MATGVINRRPDDIVRPTCNKGGCYETFEIPYKDRILVKYCPNHDRSGYWNDGVLVNDVFQDVENCENIARARIGGQWYWILSVSISGKRLLVKRGNAKPFGVSTSDVTDWTGIG